MKEALYSKSGTNFSLFAEDNFAGVNEVYSRFNDDDFDIYADNFSFDEELDTSFSYFATDNIGCSSIVEKLNIRIDDTPPITIQGTNKDIILIGDKSYVDSRYILNWSSIDGKSGVDNTFVNINGEDIESNEFKITVDGEYVIEYYSVDNLGNTEELQTLTVISPIPDRNPPETELTYSYEPLIIGSEIYFRSDIKLSLEADDLLGLNDSYASGVNYINYIVDYSEETLFDSTPITLQEGSHTLSFYAVDNVGNIESTQTQSIVIDDTPPETKIAILSSDNISVDDIVYISDKDPINLISEDFYSGVDTIHYRLGTEDSWNIFEEEFLLEYGEYIVDFYSVDNLGNEEDIKTIKFFVQKYYNIVPYQNIQDYTLFSDLKSYDIDSNNVVFILDNRTQHIFMSPITEESNNIYAEKKQITKDAKNRTNVIVGKEHIIATEFDNDASNIYLYNSVDEQQTGVQLTFSGMNTSPFNVDNYIYWKNYENSIYSVIKFDLQDNTLETVYSTDRIISSFNINKNILEFMVKDENYTEFFTIEADVLKSVFNISFDDVMSFSFNKNLIAIERDNILTLIDINNNENPIRTVPGNKPILRDFRMLFTRFEDNNTVLYEMNIGNKSLSKLSVGIDIKDLFIDESDLMSFRIKKNPELVDRFVYKFYDPENDESKYTTDYLSTSTNYNLIIKKRTQSIDLISEIKLSEDFIVHKYSNEGDLLYGDNNFLFPENLNPFNDSWYIETHMDSDYFDMSFRAESDITVFIMIENEFQENLTDLSFEESDFTLFSSSSEYWSTVVPTKKFTLLQKNYLQGELITLKTDVNEFSPIIFIVESAKLIDNYRKWDKHATYDHGDIITYFDQLYMADYYTFNDKPINGRVWKRIDVNSISIEWDKKQIYIDDNIALYKGDLYITKWWTHNNNPAKGDPWTCVSSIVNILLWDNNQTYLDGSIVLYDEKEYRNKYYSKGNNPEDGLPWELIKPEVQSWNSGTSYGANALVTHNLKKYKSKWHNKSEKPGMDKWGPWEEIIE